VRLSLPPYELEETRTGAGTPVVLLHGLSGSSRWWSRNVDALAERHLVATVDLGRFGRLPFDEIVALIARWLKTFGEPVHVLGHSMGGLLAISLAAQRPDLVRSLVLISAVGIPFKLNPFPHVAALPKPPYGGPGIARVLVPDFFRTSPASIAFAGTRVLLADIRERMRAIRVPTLLVWGAADPLVPLRYGEAMQQEIPGSRLEVIARAAHVPMWDAAADFNRLVLSFLASASSSTPASPSFSWGVSGWTNGMAHRQAGPRRDIVLVHGLGMSSAYFARFARALFERGFNPIAPDLPGFGESTNAPASGPLRHAEILASWADALSLRSAIWVGHSIGCNAVARLAQIRPELVRRAIHIGPLWTCNANPQLRFFPRLALDALREPLSLYRYVMPAYWRTGIWRWWRTWRAYLPDIVGTPPAQGVFIAGTRDPLPDDACVPLGRVAGAHACHFSDAAESASEVGRAT
jgi:pimeloyl-ACP methyl ester carboxylesterase